MAWDQAVAMLPVGISFVLAYLGLNLSDEHSPMKLLFILMSLWILVLGFTNGMEIVTAGGGSADVTSNLARGHQAIMWTTILASIYFMLMFLWRILDWLIGIAKTR